MRSHFFCRIRRGEDFAFVVYWERSVAKSKRAWPAADSANYLHKKVKPMKQTANRQESQKKEKPELKPQTSFKVKTSIIVDFEYAMKL